MSFREENVPISRESLGGIGIEQFTFTPLERPLCPSITRPYGVYLGARSRPFFELRLSAKCNCRKRSISHSSGQR